MNLSFKRIDEMLDKATNILFVAIASIVVFLMAGLALRLVLASILEPLYAYLIPKLGIFFFLFVLLVLFILLMFGEFLGSLLAKVPSLILKIRQGQIFVTFFKHLRNFTALLGVFAIAKLMIQILQQDEDKQSLLPLIQLVWDILFTF